MTPAPKVNPAISATLLAPMIFEHTIKMQVAASIKSKKRKWRVEVSVTLFNDDDITISRDSDMAVQFGTVTGYYAIKAQFVSLKYCWWR